MRTVLFLLNDAPYGSERTYNALRLALELSKGDDASIRIFAQADAVTSALKDQKTPNGYYNIERMLRALIAKGVPVRL
jgi:uncharacterized protein involved in oxidation of intracellular sulfur